tara:strand:+ start:28 stop:447 length:420 start_codon:yes stop_codon:yes gene_type:complete
MHKNIYDNWRRFLSEKKDTDKIAKAVVMKDGMALLLKRSNYMKKYAGEWDLPGGHVQEEESIEDGLRREVEEETGLKIKAPKQLSSDGRMHYYRADADDSDIELSDEHTEHKFVSVEDLEEMEIPSKYMKPLKQVLEEK